MFQSLKSRFFKKPKVEGAETPLNNYEKDCLVGRCLGSKNVYTLENFTKDEIEKDTVFFQASNLVEEKGKNRYMEGHETVYYCFNREAVEHQWGDEKQLRRPPTEPEDPEGPREKSLLFVKWIKNQYNKQTLTLQEQDQGKGFRPTIMGASDYQEYVQFQAGELTAYVLIDDFFKKQFWGTDNRAAALRQRIPMFRLHYIGQERLGDFFNVRGISIIGGLHGQAQNGRARNLCYRLELITIQDARKICSNKKTASGIVENMRKQQKIDKENEARRIRAEAPIREQNARYVKTTQASIASKAPAIQLEDEAHERELERLEDIHWIQLRNERLGRRQLVQNQYVLNRDNVTLLSTEIQRDWEKMSISNENILMEASSLMQFIRLECIQRFETLFEPFFDRRERDAEQRQRLFLGKFQRYDHASKLKLLDELYDIRFGSKPRKIDNDEEEEEVQENKEGEVYFSSCAGWEFLFNLYYRNFALKIRMETIFPEQRYADLQITNQNEFESKYIPYVDSWLNFVVTHCISNEEQENKVSKIVLLHMPNLEVMPLPANDILKSRDWDAYDPDKVLDEAKRNETYYTEAPDRNEIDLDWVRKLIGEDWNNLSDLDKRFFYMVRLNLRRFIEDLRSGRKRRMNSTDPILNNGVFALTTLNERIAKTGGVAEPAEIALNIIEEMGPSSEKLMAYTVNILLEIYEINTNTSFMMVRTKYLHYFVPFLFKLKNLPPLLAATKGSLNAGTGGGWIEIARVLLHHQITQNQEAWNKYTGEPDDPYLQRNTSYKVDKDGWIIEPPTDDMMDAGWWTYS